MQAVEYVCVKSGDYCFKFDKHECVKLMPKYEDGVLTADEIPWQIIPIACTPIQMFDVSAYNVATYIKNDNAESLKLKVKKLLDDPQFLLFLNASNIDIELYEEGTLSAKAGRESHAGEVCLLSNGSVVSRWLVHTTELIPVENAVREDLKRDFNTPEKLKEATHFEISFAIFVNKEGEIEKVANSVVYTFLPTSYRNLGLPFLVNANFITDAGRQQLHQNSKWNSLIFKSIPEYYLRWIATLSVNHKDYYVALPNIKSLSNDALTSVFDEALKIAINKVAFIPREKDNIVVKASDAVVDRVGISESITPKTLIEHINREYKRDIPKENIIAPKAITLFKEYGVFIFDKKNLPKLFEDTQVFGKITPHGDVELIEFLYTFDQDNKEEQSEFRQMLKCSKFILDESNQLSAPQDLFLPSDFRECNEITSDVVFINDSVFDDLSATTKVWLKECLELQELSNLSFVDYLYNHSDYVTPDNAIEIGRFLFEIDKEEDIFKNQDTYKLRYINFLTSKGSLNTADELYLGDIYKPELPFESLCNEDIFISPEYLPQNSNKTDITEWKLFLLKFGVSQDLSFNTLHDTRKSWENRVDSPFFDSVVSASEEYSNFAYAGMSISRLGYRFSAGSVFYKSYPMLYLCVEYNASKAIISRIISSNDAEETSEHNYICVNGYCGFFPKSVDEDMLKDAGCKYTNHFKWLIDNAAIIPTTQQKCEYAKNVYSNSIEEIELLAGPYLPVLDTTTIVTSDWLDIFPFKQHLTLKDYLTILTCVANDAKEDNKERVNRVYVRIVESGLQNDQLVKEWGQTNKILSKDGKFLPPCELSYITIDGFNNANHVYTGHVSESQLDRLMCLLKNFGVRVITKDNIKPNPIGKEKDDSLKRKLQNKLQYIATLSKNSTNKPSFVKTMTNMRTKLNNGEFFRCESIELTYGNKNDVITKTTFSHNNKFYYTGVIKPYKLEPLLSPLVKFLDLHDVENELLIILVTENHDEIVEFLKDKGYNTEFLSVPQNMPENADEYDDEGKFNRGSEYLDSKRKNAAQLEAQKVLMDSRPDWSFPTGYAICQDDGTPYFYSTVDGIIDENGDSIAIVLKSYKRNTEPFHINPEEWQWVVEHGAKLLVYTKVKDGGFDIVEVPQASLIQGQSIQLSFSTKNLDPMEHADRISQFAETLHYFKQLTFDFEQFHIDPNATRIRDIESQNKRKQYDVSDDDL